MKGIAAKIIDTIKKANLLMYLASGAEDLVKVWAENKYDALAKTEYFRKLKNLEMKEKLVIVAVMFALNAHLKINTNENTPWNLFWKGIVTDFFPEMGKRLINGNNSPDPEEQEVIELMRKTDKCENPHCGVPEKSVEKRSVTEAIKKDVKEGLRFLVAEFKKRKKS